MVALFCILRGCGQEVYGKVHKTLRALVRESSHRIGRWCKLCWKPPTESPGVHFTPAVRGEQGADL